ncbi:MAG: IS630 family transposase [Thermodesulfobacteriota bacterium]|nr:IS630 family transposase [Thermodesulfobacteriota bacterium]
MNEEVEEQSLHGRQIRLMFQDEGRFGRINEPRRCWAPKGTRPDVPIQFVREYTYAYAAVSPHDGVMDSLILPEVNAQAMSIFLAEVSKRHPDEFILMIMDQAAWHRAATLIIPENIKLVWQPPYSPQCNPVENIWDEIREKWFPNLVFKSLDDVENTLVEALVTLENDKERTQSITGFKWIISINLNAT